MIGGHLFSIHGFSNPEGPWENMMNDEMMEHVDVPDEYDPELDPAMIEVAFQKFENEQSMVGGLLAGGAAALVGAGVWALVTVLTGYQIGFMAIGIGFLVGLAVQFAGKGINKIFGVMGAALALFGCLLGNYFTVVHFVGEAEGLGFFDTLNRISPAAIPELMAITFSPMDLVFYGIAVYEGFKLSFRKITHEEIQAAITGVPIGT
jgi:hypothetical protein